jgi:hypothetical protein
MLVLAVLLLIVFPLYAVLALEDLPQLIGKIVLTGVLILVVGATGIFGYICIKAQARKWGAGLILLALLSIMAIYQLWIGLPFLS